MTMMFGEHGCLDGDENDNDDDAENGNDDHDSFEGDGGEEADDDGGGEKRAAAAGVQEGHRQGVVFKTSPKSSILGFIHKSLVKIVSITVSQFWVLLTLHHESCHQ